MRNRIYVALDTAEPSDALALAKRLRGHAPCLKVGLTLFAASGPAVVDRLRELGFEVFVDLKLHDIPHQVEGVAYELGRLGARLVTVHASGGSDMIAAAVRGVCAGARTAGVDSADVIAVTVLTSMDAAALKGVGIDRLPFEQVALLATLAKSAGASGVVCSPEEAADMRETLGPDALVVTPGVRPEWAAIGDQARIATPAQALAAGASHLVIGRPVTEADDPVVAFESIVEEIEKASDL